MNRMSPQSGLRSAFTLFEVLMALALSAILLVAVLAALDLSIRMSVAAPRSLQDAELTAALLRTIAVDVRRVEPPDSLAMVASLQSSRREHDENEDWIGLNGGESWLAGLVRDAPDHAAARTGSSSALAQDTGSRWFVYANSNAGRLVSVGDSSLISALLADALHDANDGVVRVSLARTKPNSVRSNSDVARVLLTETLANERRVRFRYYDGQGWHAEWNSRARRSLPRAVEATLLPVAAPTELAPEAAAHAASARTILISLVDRSTSAGEASRTSARPFRSARP